MPKAQKSSTQDKPREWTLMFYFASDNPLAPGILSQLKSIQQAGFHPEVNVVAQYDPYTERAPLHVFDVNKIAKVTARKADTPYQIGVKPNDAFDTFVPNLVLDKLWIEKENVAMVKAAMGEPGANYQQPRPPNPFKKKKANAADNGQEPGPRDSLESFINFCHESYPARHYMLFILGHGLVVGNDMFLFDEHAAQRSLSLKDMGKLLSSFRKKVNKAGQEFEFLSLHSCSMSALEVAYELQDTANYMLASEGPAFVGSWPYRQILMRIFQDVVEREPNVQNTLKKIFSYCLHNSTDFQLAGYSFDLCLCNLSKVAQFKKPLSELSTTLAKAVPDRVAQECILLAHWDAQSYWGESYTDLYDFCLRLSKRCQEAQETSKANGKLRAIQGACDAVIKSLEPGEDKLIISSGIAGADYQYSHGLSVFFPWAEPGGKFWLEEYGAYRFNSGSSNTKWREFLSKYFASTIREPRGSESSAKGRSLRAPRREEILLDGMALRGTGSGGQLDGPPPEGGKGSGSDATGKGSGSDATGKGSGSDATGAFGGTVIKNYPHFTLAQPKTNDKRRAVRKKR